MYEVQRKSRNIAVVRIPYRNHFEQRFLCSADRHWDNPLSDHEMQIKHLNLALRYKAGIFDFGDLFCAMQGKWDKRSRKSELRVEHKRDDYLDSLVDTAADFFEPYAQRIIMLGMGNHETGVLKKHEVNLTNRLCTVLNERTGSNIYNGGYSGWIHFQFVNEKNGHVTHKKLWYIHGYGGGGPVTRGVIQSNRKAVYLPDADFVVSGHTHDQWILPIARTRLNDCSVQKLDEQIHISIPTYKDEYNDGYLGFHVESGRGPKPIGAIWMKFFKDSSTSPIECSFYKAHG